MAGLSEPVTRQKLLSDRMERSIYDAVHREIEAAKEEIVKAAVNEFQARVRQIVGKVSLQASNFYTVHNMGNELVIKVKIEDAASDTDRPLAR